MRHVGKVILKPDGFYVNEYDESLSEASFSPAEGPIFLYLQDLVTIDKGVTVENLMNTLMSHEDEIDILCFGFSKGHKMRPFYEEMCQVPKIRRGDLTSVEIGWTADYYRSDRRGQPNELCLSMVVSGVSKKWRRETTYHNLSEMPLNEWKHLPVILCDIMRITDVVFEKGPSGRNETSFVNIMEAKKDITLYDMIGGFIETVTWFGDPSKREEHLQDLERIVSGDDMEYAAVSLEDKEYELRKAISLEDYERAVVIKQEIEYLKKKDVQ